MNAPPMEVTSEEVGVGKRLGRAWWDAGGRGLPYTCLLTVRVAQQVSHLIAWGVPEDRVHELVN